MVDLARAVPLFQDLLAVELNENTCGPSAFSLAVRRASASYCKVTFWLGESIYVANTVYPESGVEAAIGRIVGGACVIFWKKW